ncbi:MAG: hypothetical protein IPG69_02940 [Flavobacteriales bacterium]|nr:hypothetical protein [Flavobacteriales bacterium]
MRHSFEGRCWTSGINLNSQCLAPACACSGNTLTTDAEVCANENFTLSLQNLTSGIGVSYQWGDLFG